MEYIKITYRVLEEIIPEEGEVVTSIEQLFNEYWMELPVFAAQDIRPYWGLNEDARACCQRAAKTLPFFNYAKLPITFKLTKVTEEELEEIVIDDEDIYD